VQRGSLFPAACISLYTMYLQYSALQSEPRDYACNALGARLSAASATSLAAGVLLTLLSVVYSAFRAGSNTQTFRCGWRRWGVGDACAGLWVGGRCGRVWGPAGACSQVGTPLHLRASAESLPADGGASAAVCSPPPRLLLTAWAATRSR
jgi:hypothetical protein